jgi:hypothetical protein
MNADVFYFCFSIVYLIHMQEEYWTGFALKLPPPRLVGPITERGFWVLNPFLLTITTAFGVANLMGASWAFIWVALWSSICLWNSIAHVIWSVISREYQPGLYTGILYAPIFAIWTWLLTNQSYTNWSAYWNALFIGLFISIVLVGFAVIGRRIFR